MAKQRQTDVNINYKVNTVDIERGNGLLVRASKATDDLKKSSDAYAKTASAGNLKTANTIEGMTLQMQRLRAQIALTNKADTQRLAQLSGQYKSVKAQVDAYNKALLHTSTVQKQTAQSAQGMAQQFGQVYTAIKLFIAAGLARELVNMSLSAATLTGNVEGVERAFKRAFPQAKSLMNDLREATHGTVSDFELMQRTLQATNLGVDVEHLGVLFEFASTRAQQTGESVDYLVDSIVRGIGRKSTLVLDNLGLSAIRLKEHFGGVSLQALSVGQVTEGVAEIARIELEKMGGFLETSATLVSQLGVSWRGLREEISKAMTADEGGGIIGFMKEYVDSFRVMIRAFNEGITISEAFAKQERERVALSTVNEFIERRFTKDKKENIKIVQEEIEAITKEIGLYTRFRDPIEKVIAEKREELALKQSSLLVDKAGLPIKTAEVIELENFLELNKRILEDKKADALIDQEIIELLRSKLAALKAVVKEEEAAGKGDGKRGHLMKPLTQVVDIRFKDPKTGQVATKEHYDKVIRDFASDSQAVLDAMPLQMTVTPFILMTDWEKAFEAQKQDIINAGSNIVQDIYDSELKRDLDGFNARIDATQAYYDRQVELAGDNDRLKKELRIKEERELKKIEKERADREKKAALASIRVQTALAIIKVFSGEGTFADKIIKAGIVGATGLSQYLIASRERYYAKGEIDIKGGTPGKDSIPAMLTPHESIMTAQETGSSGGILRSIRAKKLNDQVLKEIVSGRSGGAMGQKFDDSRIIKELQELKNSSPDIVERGGVLFKAKKKSDSFTQYMRLHTIGKL